MRKWRNAQVFPKWKSVDKMLQKLSKEKIKLTNNEDIEYLKERGKIVYTYIKIFQKILNYLKSEKNSSKPHLNNLEIELFFERYYYWHNYHAMKLYATKFNT